VKNRLMIVLLLASLWSSRIVFSADHGNLEEGLPVQVEDAYPTAYLNREIQFATRYQHNDDKTDQWLFRPILEFGIWRNTEIEIESDLFAGNADRTGSGDVALRALYNFNTESLAWPALAVSGGIIAPTGENSSGLDSSAKFIMSKTLFNLNKIHANFIWNNNDKPDDDERRNRYATVLGYSMPLNADTLLIVDYVREQQREKDKESNIIELGTRYRLNPRTVLAFGFGVGVGEESPDVRAIFGFQYSF
jgi:hypothetical protein